MFGRFPRVSVWNERVRGLQPIRRSSRPLIAKVSAAKQASERDSRRDRKGKDSGTPGRPTSERRDKGTSDRNSSKSKTAKDPAGHAQNANDGVLRMLEYKQDETLLFTPVKAGRNAVRVIYSYPNEYSVGITSLGYQLVWAFFDSHENADVARLFTDANDPLPRDPELVGFSLSWELDYANMLSLLERLGIPILAQDRTLDHPLVFGGGPVLTANPEPYAAFFDVVLLGDGEDLLTSFLQAYSGNRLAAVRGEHAATPESRTDLLRALSAVPGVYVPQLYQPSYQSPTGPLTGIVPLYSDVPPVVQKQTYRGSTLARSMVVSPRMAWENIFMVEVVRSCPEMCRFCMASYLTLPFRAAPLEASLLPAIQQGLQVTDRIGLLGASVTQHPEFEALLHWILQTERESLHLSIASVRTNTVTPLLASALASRGTRSLTVAVESGSERIRRIVNKKLAQEDILRCAQNAQEGGLQGLKLYGMVGVPGEEEEDIQATIDLLLQVKEAAPKLRLTFGCSTFVPKSHTPFQWWGVDPKADGRLKRLDKALGKAGIEFRPESYKWSLVQAFLSRGDRRVSKLLLRVREHGDTIGSFRRAYKEMPGQLPAMDHYVHEQWGIGTAVLPWAHLHGPLPETTLVKHAHEAMSYMPAHAEAPLAVS